MAEKPNGRNTGSQIRSTAMKHALNIEEKKRLKIRVADLVLRAYDLPSSANADPAHPSSADAALFRECLNLFQSSDLDDLIQERNIDNRCGYALCPRQNQKVAGGGEMVWNKKGGKEFKIVSRAQMERWCSQACGNRTAFVRTQLSAEPSWIRETHNDVRLLDEVGQVDDPLGATKVLAEGDSNQEVVERLQALSLERGDEMMQDVSDQVDIIEKSSIGTRPRPPTRRDQSVEGYRPRKVHFSKEAAAGRSNC